MNVSCILCLLLFALRLQCVPLIKRMNRNNNKLARARVFQKLTINLHEDDEDDTKDTVDTTILRNEINASLRKSKGLPKRRNRRKCLEKMYNKVTTEPQNRLKCADKVGDKFLWPDLFQYTRKGIRKKITMIPNDVNLTDNYLNKAVVSPTKRIRWNIMDMYATTPIAKGDNKYWNEGRRNLQINTYVNEIPYRPFTSNLTLKWMTLKHTRIQKKAKAAALRTKPILRSKWVSHNLTFPRQPKTRHGDERQKCYICSFNHAGEPTLFTNENKIALYFLAVLVPLLLLTICICIRWRIKSRLPSVWFPVGKLSEMYIYPVKSCGPLYVSRGHVTRYGLKCDWVRDRCYMVIDERNKFVTSRLYPELLTVKPELCNNNSQLVLSHKRMEPLNLPEPQNNKQITAYLWGTAVPVLDCGKLAADWFTRLLCPCGTTYFKLVAFNSNTTLKMKDGYLVDAFFDRSNFHIINYNTVQDINSRVTNTCCQAKSLNYRPNFVVTGRTAAFAEDKWKFVKIGNVIFEVTRLCARCIVIAHDPETGGKNSDNEPFSTLQRHRHSGANADSRVKGDFGPTMGLLMALRGRGQVVSLGDVVYAAEKKCRCKACDTCALNYSQPSIPTSMHRHAKTPPGVTRGDTFCINSECDMQPPKLTKIDVFFSRFPIVKKSRQWMKEAMVKKSYTNKKDVRKTATFTLSGESDDEIKIRRVGESSQLRKEVIVRHELVSVREKEDTDKTSFQGRISPSCISLKKRSSSMNIMHSYDRNLNKNPEKH